MLERLQDTIDHFEATHPTLTTAAVSDDDHPEQCRGITKINPRKEADESTRPLLLIKNRVQSPHPILKESNAQHYSERNRSLSSSPDV